MSSVADYPLTSARLKTESACLITSQRELDVLVNRAQHLLAREGTAAQPAFYTASLIRRRWAPAVIAVWDSNELAGIVYLKERRIAGFRTGIYYGDATLDALVIAEPERRGRVLLTSMNALLERSATRAIRLLVPQDGYELNVIEQVSKANQLEIRSKPVRLHERLPLQANYEDFLDSLGPKTRRNFRYYRRRFEALNHQYIQELNLADFQSAALSLVTKDVTGTEPYRLAHAFGVLSSVSKPLLCGLRHHDGSWLSVLGGWYDSGRAIVFFQVNSAKHHAELSLSVVTRGYVLEELIARGIRDVLFWGGTSEPLQRYSQPIPTERFYLDKRDTGWRATRACLRSLNTLVPQRWAHYADWILPPAKAE